MALPLCYLHGGYVAGLAALRWRDSGKKRKAVIMTIEVALVISCVSVAFSVYFGIKNSRKSDTEDITKRVERDTKVNMKLDNITNMVNDIKYDISATKKEVQNLSERMASVEASAKQAHHRIDRLDGTKVKEGNDDE